MVSSADSGTSHLTSQPSLTPPSAPVGHSTAQGARKATHTPGPWTVEERGGGIVSALSEGLEPAWTHIISMPAPPFAFGATGAAVSAGYSWDKTVNSEAREVAAANANLIAAAPDLLAALRDIRAACADAYKAGRIDAEPFVRAGNAIAKAEGR